MKTGKYRTMSCSCGCVYSYDPIDLDEENKVACPECYFRNSVERPLENPDKVNAPVKVPSYEELEPKETK